MPALTGRLNRPSSSVRKSGSLPCRVRSTELNTAVCPTLWTRVDRRGSKPVDSVPFVAPYFDLRRALWIPAVLTWDATGVSRREEGPRGFASYQQAAEASRFLARAVTRKT